ncbi:MAG: LytR C-terminal domain-containing protein [Lachnospiraceae bacterium]|nr:LytR C-terminal domain-containing protein [Lachnospiraceae bacterium]
MKKQSMVGLFFSMFLRATVIILAIVIVVFGVVFASKVMANKGDKKDSPATTASPNVLTEAEGHDDLLYADPTETTEYIVADDTTEAVVEPVYSYDANILVLNSTDEIGLAGRWCETLNGFGYANTSASDYSTPQEYTRVISTTPGLGEDLVQYFNNATYEVGTVTTGSSESTEGYDIVVIIGIGDGSY